MNNASLDSLIQHPAINNDPVLTDLLYAADTIDGSILIAPDFFNMTTEYIGDAIEDLSGTAAQEWMRGGMPLLISRMAESDHSRLASLHSAFAQQAKAAHFDPRTIAINEYPWTLLCPDGKQVAVTSIVVVLNYTHGMDFRLGLGLIMPRSRHVDQVTRRCRSHLIQIKMRHNIIYRHDAFQIVPDDYRMSNNGNGTLAVTFRQHEVLSLLARGLSTKQIADQLNISNHTVESHRKSLLEKFAAKNVAELIMKASKIFWFD